MFRKLFSRKPKEEVTHIKFREGIIGALAMEVYKNHHIFYLSKPHATDTEKKQPIYHILHKGKFYYAEAPTIEELEALAHEDIDNNFKNHNLE